MLGGTDRKLGWLDPSCSHLSTATVSMGDARWEVSVDSPLTFGRAESCTICLDPDDLGISRYAGSVEYQAGTWWLTNRSNTRLLMVVSERGLAMKLEPGRRVAVDEPLAVEVHGSIRRHALQIRPPEELAPPPLGSPPGDLRTVGAEVVYSDRDRMALAALFEGYLLPFPRYDPHPRTYAEAAARLGWPRTTVTKRIEHLRARLTDAGVGNLEGPNALRHLGEYVLATGVITEADLASLP